MQHNNQLTTLLNDIGKQFILRNIDKYVSYCQIRENLKDKTYISTINYDGNLDEALKKVSQNIELKFSYCLDECYSILDLLNMSYNQLLIGQADCILINRGQGNLLKLTNDRDPKSNIAIIVDVNSIKQDLIEEYNNRRSLAFRHKLTRNIMDFIGLIFISSIFIVFIYKFIL